MIRDIFSDLQMNLYILNLQRYSNYILVTCTFNNSAISFLTLVTERLYLPVRPLSCNHTHSPTEKCLLLTSDVQRV